MQKLIAGLHRFQSEVFASQRALFDRLAVGQNPEALFITCSDSRISPNLITQTNPGDLFILRNAGNIVPPYTHNSAGEAATIEYAVVALNVRDIIVCGHTKCGAVQGLLNPEALKAMPAVERWLQHAESTARIIQENYAHLEGEPRVVAAVEENVLVQLENLKTHPSVAARIAAGKLNLHAWVYKIETGQVFYFNHEEHEFQLLTEAPQMPPTRRFAAAGI